MVLNGKIAIAEIKPTSKNVLRFLDLCGGDNLEEIVMRGVRKNDIRTFAHILMSFSDLKDEESACDFIDECRRHGDGLREMYKSFIDELNNEYFFVVKLSAEELETKINNPIDLNVDEMAQEIFRQVVQETAQRQIRDM